MADEVKFEGTAILGVSWEKFLEIIEALFPEVTEEVRQGLLKDDIDPEELEGSLPFRSGGFAPAIQSCLVWMLDNDALVQMGSRNKVSEVWLNEEEFGAIDIMWQNGLRLRFNLAEGELQAMHTARTPADYADAFYTPIFRITRS